MAYEQRDNSGSLFKNKKKTEEKHPGYTGKALIGGVEYWVSAWGKKDRNGEQWISLAFTEKEANGAAASNKSQKSTDDDLTF